MLKVSTAYKNVEQNKNVHLRMRIAIISCGTNSEKMYGYIGERNGMEKNGIAQKIAVSNRIKIVVVVK